MRQTALPFVWPEGEAERDFVEGRANAAAVRHLAHWSLWPVMATLLTGPRKSGRSLLGRLFAAKSGGVLIDDADAKPEETLFHAWNAAQAARRPLLLIANAAPPEWPVALPDLGSRLAATPRVAIDPPDDALVAALLARQLARRGLAPTPELLGWLGRRIERSYVGVLAAVDRIDDAALAANARATVPFVRRLFADAVDADAAAR